MPARGNAPGADARAIDRPEGAEGPCALSGRPAFDRYQTQGVALGWHPAALSAPQDA